MAPPPPAFEAWLAALEARHLANLRFPEVVRALRALSSTYVERRARLSGRGSLDSDGKRAAFALYYGPVHWRLVHAVVQQIPGAMRPARRLLDLGCGSGAAGAGWATLMAPPAAVSGLDLHPWTIGEAAFTYRQCGLHADVRRGHAERSRWPRADAVLAAFLANELSDPDRDALLARLLDAARGGARVLVVEPLSKGVAPWWPAWADAAVRAGGRADEWRLDVALPSIVTRLADAAGLRPQGVAGRSVWIDGSTRLSVPHGRVDERTLG
jgi:SAM-dependent methyltransferase